MEQEPKKTERQWILNPSEVTRKDESRIRAWSQVVMERNEYKFNSKWKNKEIVTSGEVEPEAIDVRAIYPFAELHWFIYRDDPYWSFILASDNKILFRIQYAKI